MKSAGGSSCDVTCSARGGCDETAWPKSEQEFEAVAEEAGHVCVGTQAGGAKYDPSTDGRYCGWDGPDEANSGEARCSTAGDSGTYRFCPCFTDKEL